jgi:RNA polymerase-binding transcription factor
MLASNLEQHQLASIRKILDARAAVLKHRLSEARSGISEGMGGEVRDTKEQAFIEAADEVRDADLVRERAELADIGLALARIDIGTYGMCSDCGRSIGRRRLKAYPAAKRCHDCQESYEQQVRHAAAN